MNVVILGAKGMLGSDLVSLCQKLDFNTLGVDQPELDICSYDSVRVHIPACDWVINCAAFTNVDGSETEAKAAFAVNERGARNVARACKRRKINLLHISTDYVFDGTRQASYTERSRANPINVYGASKLAGERAIRAEGCRYVIVRTQSLFGRHGGNFVKAILGQLKAGKEQLHVVADQVSSPTYTAHLAEAIVKILPLDRRGIVNISASGECSWFEFASAIAEQVSPSTWVRPISSKETERAAARPKYSVLDNGRYSMWTGHRMPSWQEGLTDYLKEEGY